MPGAASREKGTDHGGSDAQGDQRDAHVDRRRAVGSAAGPGAGLELLAPLLADPALDRYAPLHAVHAELLRRGGDPAAAAEAFARPIALTANTVERAELERRRGALP